MSEVTINELEVSNTKPFTLIAGLNVLESDKVIDQVITSCIEVTQKLNIPYVFKASYDKANRSSMTLTEDLVSTKVLVFSQI